MSQSPVTLSQTSVNKCAPGFMCNDTCITWVIWHGGRNLVHGFTEQGQPTIGNVSGFMCMLNKNYLTEYLYIILEMSHTQQNWWQQNASLHIYHQYTDVDILFACIGRMQFHHCSWRGDHTYYQFTNIETGKPEHVKFNSTYISIACVPKILNWLWP